MSASEANAKAAQAALELQEAQVVRSQAERAKALKSEKDMKEEMEAQQLGYKLWTIDTSIDPKKKQSTAHQNCNFIFTLLIVSVLRSKTFATLAVAHVRVDGVRL